MKFYVLSGAIKNSGDFLIVERSINLLKKVYPNSTICIIKRNQSIQPYLPEINNASALIYAGGPNVCTHEYPGSTPLIKNLDEIKVPVLTLGFGWYGKDDSNKELYRDFYLDDTTEEMFRRLEHDGTLSCRDWDTVNVLRRLGHRQLIMTGCPAWYSGIEVCSNKADSCLKKLCNRGEGLHIGISDPGDTAWLFQSKKLVRYVRRKYPKAKVSYFFHRGIFKDTHTEKKEQKRLVAMTNFLQDECVPYTDISYSADGFHYYDKCDIHIGMRVHAHIYNLSIGNPSILVEEDARGAGMNKTLGGDRIKVYRSRSENKIVDVLEKKIMRKHYIENEYMVEEVDNYLQNLCMDGFLPIKNSFNIINKHYQTMIQHISNFSHIIDGYKG